MFMSNREFGAYLAKFPDQADEIRVLTDLWREGAISNCQLVGRLPGGKARHWENPQECDCKVEARR